MALFRRNADTPTQPLPTKAPRSIIASAANISEEGASVWRARMGEDAWQREAWYQYDICGELRYATNWVANAVSMASMFAAEVDQDTSLVTGPTEDLTVQKIVSTVLGGAVRRSQLQSTIALNWQVAGEVFILIRSARPMDEWLVLSSTEINERGGTFSYRDPVTGGFIEMNPRRDMLIRVWSPHPRFQSHSDSAVRAALPSLKEIERTSQNIAARLDSRLAGAGVWIIPKELDFPEGDQTPEGPQGLMDTLRRAAEASLSAPGQASSQVPIILEAPGEHVQNFAFQSFSTELTQEVLDLRESAIKRLALALDMPLEILMGTGETNHWSAWQIEEAAYKVHIAPLLDRIADGITTTYFRPALRAAGIENPEKYVLAFDVTDIVTRPNRVEEITSLWDRLLVSDEALRTEAGVPDSDIPSDEEADKRYVMKLVLQDTTLLADPGIRTILGLEQLEAAQPSQPELPAPASPQEEEEQNALPERSAQPDDTPSEDPSITAAAELMVWDALSRAGGRLLTREHRGQFSDTPKHLLHTVIAASDVDRLLEGSFQFASQVAPQFGMNPEILENSLRGYCRSLLTQGQAHDREAMRTWLTK